MVLANTFKLSVGKETITSLLQHVRQAAKGKSHKMLVKVQNELGKLGYLFDSNVCT